MIFVFLLNARVDRASAFKGLVNRNGDRISLMRSRKLDSQWRQTTSNPNKNFQGERKSIDTSHQSWAGRRNMSSFLGVIITLLRSVFNPHKNKKQIEKKITHKKQTIGLPLGFYSHNSTFVATVHHYKTNLCASPPHRKYYSIKTGAQGGPSNCASKSRSQNEAPIKCKT